MVSSSLHTEGVPWEWNVIAEADVVDIAEELMVPSLAVAEAAARCFVSDVFSGVIDFVFGSMLPMSR